LKERRGLAVEPKLFMTLCVVGNNANTDGKRSRLLSRPTPAVRA
jgi:hypothetical protein